MYEVERFEVGISTRDNPKSSDIKVQTITLPHNWWGCLCCCFLETRQKKIWDQKLNSSELIEACEAREEQTCGANKTKSVDKRIHSFEEYSRRHHCGCSQCTHLLSKSIFAGLWSRLVSVLEIPVPILSFLKISIYTCSACNGRPSGTISPVFKLLNNIQEQSYILTNFYQISKKC